MVKKEKVSVIVPAYNEAANIRRVVDVIIICSFIDEIIVVDDGSKDDTSSVVGEYPRIQLIKHQINLGKGAAVVSGVKKAKNSIIVLIDADLVGLREEHLLKLISPVASGEYDLSLGIFGLKEISATKIASNIFPWITGQRAIRKSALPPLENIINSRYGVDYLITKNVARKRRKIVKLPGLSQIIKEKKGNPRRDIWRNRAKMYSEIAKASRQHKRTSKRVSKSVNKQVSG